MGICPADVEEPLPDCIASDKVLVLDDNSKQVRALAELEGLVPVGVLATFVMRLGLVRFIADRDDAIGILRL